MVEINNQNIPNLTADQNQIKSALDQNLATQVPLNNATEAIGKVVENPDENTSSKIARTLVSVAELSAAAPLVLGSLLNQADNITRYGANRGDDGLVGLLTSVVETLSYPFRLFVDKYVVKSSDVNDVRTNKRSFLFDDIYQRLLHPNIAKEFTSFLFTFRRAIFNFFPDVFTVPSEEHDPDNPRGRVASGITASFLKTLSTITSPVRFFTSLTGLFILSPFKLLSAIYAYTGNQKLFDSTKELSSIANIFNPIIANLSSTYSVAKAYWDSYTKKESTLVTFGKYNLTALNMVQGILGSVLSVPQFFGALAKLKNKISEKDENNSYKVVGEIKNLVGEIAPHLKAINLFGNQTVASIQNKVEDSLNKFIHTTGEQLINFCNSVVNSNKPLQSFASIFRSRNLNGEVLAISSQNADIERNEDKYFNGILQKSNFFSELYDLLQPAQSLLMLLPNAFVPIGDPYITDNAIRPFRVLDRLLGINSMILSIPNFVVYALSTRVPQMILKYYEIKQRKAEVNGDRYYDAYTEYNKLLDMMKKVPVFGSTYLSKILSELDVNPSIFKDSEMMARVYEDFENEAKEQEPSVKASELVSATRIGMRTLLNHKLFNSERDPETGLTAEEKSRDKIYKSLGTFKEGIARIPIFGWAVSPFLELFRGMYKVDTKRTRKLLPGISSRVSRKSPTEASNPLAALAQNLAPQT